jgi:hypothetical protein
MELIPVSVGTEEFEISVLISESGHRFSDVALRSDAHIKAC